MSWKKQRTDTRPTSPSPRVVVLDDHITPYRVPLFEALSRQNVDLTVLFCTRRLPDRSWTVQEPLGFPYAILPNVVLRLSRPPYNEPRWILINPTLLWTLIRLNPDVVVGYAFSFPAWTAFLYAKLFRKRFISWSTDTLHTERFLGRIQRFARRVIIPRADGYITASHDGREKFILYGADPSNIFIAVQTADTRRFSQAAAQARASGIRYSPNQPIKGPVILCVGTLSERKGVRYLLDAMPTVRASIPEAQLILAGDGPILDELQRHADALQISDMVHFAGFVQPRDLPALYASASVFAFPTLEDTFGTVLAEAAACGLPLVASCYAAATGELVKHSVNGLIVDPTEPGALASALIEVLGDESKRQRMGAMSAEMMEVNNVERAAENFCAALTHSH